MLEQRKEGSRRRGEFLPFSSPLSLSWVAGAAAGCEVHVRQMAAGLPEGQACPQQGLDVQSQDVKPEQTRWVLSAAAGAGVATVQPVRTSTVRGEIRLPLHLKAPCPGSGGHDSRPLAAARPAPLRTQAHEDSSPCAGFRLLMLRVCSWLCCPRGHETAFLSGHCPRPCFVKESPSAPLPSG